jgi:hypothetical protein
MKHILVLIAVLGLAFGVSAQVHKSQNFLKTPTATLTVADNTTTNLPATVYNDAAVYASLGTPVPAAILVSVIGTNAAASNTFTFTFRTVPDGVVTDSVRSFVVTLAANGTNRASISTNLPSTLLPGVKAVRLVTVATSDEAGNATGMTASAKLLQFAP